MWIFCIIISLIVIGIVYLLYKLNLYITTIEDKLKKQIILTENLKQSLKELIVEDFLLSDGRLKKFHIQTERNVIYNGQRVSEQTIEF